MKVHQFGFWEQESYSSSPPSASSPTSSSSSSSLTQLVNVNRLRPADAASGSSEIITSLGLSSSPKLTARCISQDHSSLMDQATQVAGSSTRWNPTAEQIKVLEALYRGSTRTPNARQIEQITSELGKYGRIEGKNVFYWFQNHKARERQKQKRSAGSDGSVAIRISYTKSSTKVQFQQHDEEEEKMSCKRKCRRWRPGSSSGDVHDHEQMELQGSGKEALELFPLQPERRIMQMGS